MILFEKIKKYLLYAYVFYVVYTPVINTGPLFDKYAVLYGLLVVVLLPYVLRRDVSVLRILSRKSIVILMLSVFISSLYFTAVQIANNVEIGSFMDLRIIQNNIINVLIVHAAVIVDMLQKRGFTRRQAFELLLKFGALQGVICLLGLVIPYFKELAVSFYEAAGGANPFVIEARIYGISSDYTFGTPIYHGLLAGVAVYYSVRDRIYRYYPLILLTLLAAFLNGRTGIVLFLVVAVLSIIFLYIKKREKRKILIALGSIAVAVTVVMSFIGHVSPSTQQFIARFVEDTHNLLFEQELTGNYQILIEDSLNIPARDGAILFGEGLRVYDASAEHVVGFRSDIGYVNDMYMGGIVFMALLYVSMFYFLLADGKTDRILFVLIVLVILLANFKGEIFRSSIVMFLIVYLKLLTVSFKQEKRVS
ncbi:hypothetical protein PV379_01985 [Streptomyces caniscabiei]|uniref:hypothetical protein n=1 Tax=Streptomyces caniscabiei TaxID=2746961 RepID=UPI0029B2E144|nr:hypothetical protein [Streptomyces caniscabiei]MDX2776123.1 hypothetical protein [Streptomyces caniscabiei]